MFNLRITALLAVLVFLVEFAAAGQLKIGITNKVEDCPRKAKNHDVVHVHYTGKLAEDGTVFDSSINRGQPIAFELGVGRVIQGWDQGVLGMCIGEKRKLSIPSELGYGSRGAGGAIPPNADLIFDVELVEIEGYQPPIKDEL
jgi:FKBP-type peptidyl-prolyl cis-trans isomerase